MFLYCYQLHLTTLEKLYACVDSSLWLLAIHRWTHCAPCLGKYECTIVDYHWRLAVQFADLLELNLHPADLVVQAMRYTHL